MSSELAPYHKNPRNNAQILLRCGAFISRHMLKHEPSTTIRMVYVVYGPDAAKELLAYWKRDHADVTGVGEKACRDSAMYASISSELAALAAVGVEYKEATPESEVKRGSTQADADGKEGSSDGN